MLLEWSSSAILALNETRIFIIWILTSVAAKSIYKLWNCEPLIVMAENYAIPMIFFVWLTSSNSCMIGNPEID